MDKTEIRFEPPIAPSAEGDEDDDTGPKHKFYKSDKILGKLYRAIDEKKIWKDDIHLIVNRSGSSLWDELFVHITSQCKENLGVVDWERALDEAHSIRQAYVFVHHSVLIGRLYPSRYDDAIWTATIDYSDHSSKCITEQEVFTGTIFNKSGIQTRRQRDTSIRLKDEFDRTTKWVEGLIRKHEANSSNELPDGIIDDQQKSDYEESINLGTDITALELSIACLHAGLIKRGRGGPKKRNVDEFESFKIIAAHCALRELEHALKEKEMAEGAAFLSGGFPGVRSGKV